MIWDSTVKHNFQFLLPCAESEYDCGIISQPSEIELSKNIR